MDLTKKDGYLLFQLRLPGRQWRHLSQKSIRSFRHLELQNLSNNSDFTGIPRWLKKTEKRKKEQEKEDIYDFIED